MLRHLDRVILAVALPCVGMLLLVVMAGVVCRAIGQPLSWTDEASGYLMVWSACFGWMAASRKGTHIKIRFFSDHLPRLVRLCVGILIELSLLLLGMVLIFKSLHLVIVNWDVEATSLPISSALLYLPLLPAGLMMFVQALLDVRMLFIKKADQPLHGETS